MIPRVAAPMFLLGAAATAAAGQTVRTAEVNDVSLPYVVEGDGPPLVLIHGWAVNHHFWDGDVAALARHYTVIRYDRRGFGSASGRPDPTADAADLAALLEHLGYPRAHVVGHSQGAATALTFAIRYPGMVRTLVLFGPGPALTDRPLPTGGGAPPFAEWISQGRAHGVDSLRAAVMRWTAEAFGGDLTPDLMERARGLLRTYSGADLLEPAPPLNLAPLPRSDDLRAVSAPTLVVHGEQEMAMILLEADVLASGIPGAQRVAIAGGGHVVNWQEPERFHAEILRFLRHAEASR